MRDSSKFSTESFRDDVSIQNWNYSIANVNESFQDFYNKLDECVNRHAPLKKNNLQIKLHHKPWLTTRILRMIKI